jgi:anti-sigma-K factor RskA
VAGTIDENTFRELLPGYALGSLSPEEAEAVRVHLAHCRDCRAELAKYQDVTGSLGLAAAEHEPPPDLEARLLERIASEATRSALRPRRSAAALQRRSAPWRAHPVAAAVAAALILALGATNVVLLTKLPRPRSAGPSLVTVALVGTNAARGAYGTIVLDMDDNRGVLAVRGLEPLDPGRQYQLWITRGSERRSGGLFSVTDDGYGSLQITVPREFTGFTGFGISIEPSGGSAGPTGERVMSGTI